MLIANKAVVIGGRAYTQGSPVDGSSLAHGKAQQLIAQRVLRDDAVSSPATCVVLRDVRVNGKLRTRGSKVSVSRLTPGKVAQMLDHRILGLTV